MFLPVVPVPARTGIDAALGNFHRLTVIGTRHLGRPVRITDDYLSTFTTARPRHDVPSDSASTVM
ncbi:hypothetical protein AXA44_08960 [Rhodococcus sp. SC4]|nr:hypothetical protein AXA44_08960 [Rhodococcus sp. SC4]KXX58056.1 hypothetical protein AZG88_46905 [Rhodococcus sp. LB1]